MLHLVHGHMIKQLKTVFSALINLLVKLSKLIKANFMLLILKGVTKRLLKNKKYKRFPFLRSINGLTLFLYIW